MGNIINIKLEEIFNQGAYFAHLKENFDDKEYLEDHLNKTKYYFEKLKLEKNIQNIINSFNDKNENFSLELSNEEKELIFDIFFYSIYLHDLGKLNPSFQFNKMKNKNFKKYKSRNSQHSIISSLMLYDLFFYKINELENLNKFTYSSKNTKLFIEFIIIKSIYIVSRHHSPLQDFHENIFRKDLNDLLQEESYFINYLRKNELFQLNIRQKKAQNFQDKMKNNSLLCQSIYIYCKMLYSLLTTCDRYATDDYANNEINEVYFDNSSLKEIYKNYNNSDLIKGIRKFENNNILFTEPINNLRSEMFLECEKNIKNNLDYNIFYVEMPTGSGKSNNSLNLSLYLANQLDDINSIMYVLPFNSIAEQTYNNLCKYEDANKDYIHLLNSITPISKNLENSNLTQDEEYKYYHDVYQNYQFLHYPITVTSHVKLFSILFSTNLLDSLILQKLCNSVIILDEIQTYKNSIWTEIITMLERYAKLLNIKFIIMSATLPKLSKLSKNKNIKTIDLINDHSKYYKNPLFRNRVKIDYSLLKIDNKQDMFDRIYKESLVIKNKKIVVEFIKKKTAKQFFNAYKDKINNIYLLTGDTNSIEKKNIIDLINSKDEIFVVTTQVLEAGVDVSFDIGFKDISTIDADEQFLGRIARSCEKEGIAYFFNLDDTISIYKNDVRTNFSLLNKEMQQILIEKDFDLYYDEVLNMVEKNVHKFNSNNIEFFYEKLLTTQFNEINKIFTLIDENNSITVILEDKIIDKETNEVIDSRDLVNQYFTLIKSKSNMPYAKFKVNLSNIMTKLSLFERNVFEYQYKELLDEGYELDNSISKNQYFKYLVRTNIFI